MVRRTIKHPSDLLPEGSKPEEMMTCQAVADRLQLSVASIFRMVRSGELRGHKFGKRTIRIPASAFRDYLDRTQVKPAEPGK